MLQLPTPKTAFYRVKSGPMKGMPQSCQASCPVLLLGIEYEELVLQHHEADRLGLGAEADRTWKKMARIAEKASNLTPKSFEGAAFQIMLAYSEISPIRTGSTEQVKDASRARAERLLFRAMERIGYKNDDGWAVLRRWLLPQTSADIVPSKQAGFR